MPSASPSPSLHPNRIYLSVQHSLSTCCLPQYTYFLPFGFDSYSPFFSVRYHPSPPSLP